MLRIKTLLFLLTFAFILSEAFAQFGYQQLLVSLNNAHQESMIPLFALNGKKIRILNFQGKIEASCLKNTKGGHMTLLGYQRGARKQFLHPIEKAVKIREHEKWIEIKIDSVKFFDPHSITLKLELPRGSSLEILGGSGQTKINHFSGKLLLKRKGFFDLNEISGDLHIEADHTGGKLQLSQNYHKQCKIRTQRGNLWLTIDPSSNSHLKLEVKKGKFYNGTKIKFQTENGPDFVKKRAKLRGEKGDIDVKAAYGNIFLRKG